MYQFLIAIVAVLLMQVTAFSKTVDFNSPELSLVDRIAEIETKVAVIQSQVDDLKAEIAEIKSTKTESEVTKSAELPQLPSEEIEYVTVQECSNGVCRQVLRPIIKSRSSGDCPCNCEDCDCSMAAMAASGSCASGNCSTASNRPFFSGRWRPLSRLRRR